MKKSTLKITILSISLLVMTITAVSAALGDISNAFPDAKQNTIKLIVSLPALITIPFTVLCGKLSNYFSKRKLLFIGLTLFLVGGVGPSFFNNLVIILVLRAVFGIGMGFVMPLATGLIADFYEGGERTTMMGLQSAAINIGAIITSFIAGFLSEINWHYVFLVYLLGLIVFILTFLKLPEPKKHQLNKSAENSSLSWKIYSIAFLALIYSLLIFSFFTNIAMVIVDEGLGNAASAGIVITIMTAGGLLAGIIFGRVSQILKGFTISSSVVLAGIGFILLSFSYSYSMILMASLIIGVGFGTTMPAIMIKIAEITPKSATTLAIAVVTGAISFGQFVSPFVLSFIAVLFNSASGRVDFFLSGVGITLGGVGLLLFSLKSKEVEKSIGRGI